MQCGVQVKPPMKSFPHHSITTLTLAASVIVAVTFLSGCVGMRTDGEKQARQDEATVGQVYRPSGERPALPKLDTNAPLHDFLLFAMLNQPQVEAAYYDWSRRCNGSR